MSDTLQRYAVIGNPIKHSLSPKIHHAFAVQQQKSLRYTMIQAPLYQFPETVKKFFNTRGQGLNITAPFKQQAFEIADFATPAAQSAKAANTLSLSQTNKIIAHNTDGMGLLTDLIQNHALYLQHKRILMIGAGGAARGILSALLQENPALLCISNRTVQHAEDLVLSFKTALSTPAKNQNKIPLIATPLSHLYSEPFDLILNATSAGQQQQCPLISLTAIGRKTIAYDLSYGAAALPFLSWAAAKGIEYYDGMGMLIEQAACAFKIWHGVMPETEFLLKEKCRMS